MPSKPRCDGGAFDFAAFPPLGLSSLVHGPHTTPPPPPTPRKASSSKQAPRRRLPSTPLRHPPDACPTHPPGWRIAALAGGRTQLALHLARASSHARQRGARTLSDARRRRRRRLCCCCCSVCSAALLPLLAASARAVQLTQARQTTSASPTLPRARHRPPPPDARRRTPSLALCACPSVRLPPSALVCLRLPPSKLLAPRSTRSTAHPGSMVRAIGRYWQRTKNRNLGTQCWARPLSLRAVRSTFRCLNPPPPTPFHSPPLPSWPCLARSTRSARRLLP